MEKPEDLPYSEAIKEVESILQHIENRELDIDDLSGNVNRALALIKACKSKLRHTEQDLQKALNDMDSDAPEEPAADA
ncbi:exodeoxyribonuclease VII small subunit [Roseivirga sp. BDSF3-8]|uniref:exodeoxyribonuclease VII small subunit n=1 Tax=Roseivirga sp. BDSF3-8 TaxID=3241598 RepID=UPI003531E36C